MKKSKIILFGILGFISLIIGLYFLEESFTNVVFNQGNVYNTTIYEEYTDPGVELFHNNHIIPKENYSIETSNNIDINKLGEYEVIYDIKYHLRKFHVKRIVNVVDDVKPIITANLEKIERDYCTRKDKKELTYEVSDNYDGKIENIVKEEVDENIVLSATDASGNTGTLTIPIDYGKKPSNQIKLSGSSTTYVKLNGTYKEAGAAYYDGCGKKLDEKITTSGSVDTKKTGTYTITYTASTGKKATRKIVVYKPSAGVVTGNGNGKIIYLTFDDGPGPYTQKILDTLAKYNVKATFFVTYQRSARSYVNLIKKEYDAGHAVAVHTYTHDDNWSMYKSVDAYVNDFNKMNDVIEQQIGHKVKMFRFPGGSSNTVSRRYGKGIVRKIADYMTNAGYRYFDWDVGSGDTDGSGSRTKIYNNVINGARTCKTCIILMHDIKPNTANELDHILSTLTSKGYRFGTLSMTSPTVHHKIAN
jgi:peptidoglycan/xylan/chitin deacetylase (PgdA/CDA1 family)